MAQASGPTIDVGEIQETGTVVLLHGVRNRVENVLAGAGGRAQVTAVSLDMHDRRLSIHCLQADLYHTVPSIRCALSR